MQRISEFDQLVGSLLFVTKTSLVKLSSGAFSVAGKAPAALAIPRPTILRRSMTLTMANALLIRMPPRRENIWTTTTNVRALIAIPATLPLSGPSPLAGS
jgi:hypothetical protein